MSNEITTPIPAATPAPTLYVQAFDGEFDEVQDVIYPPDTVFYVKHADGTFEPENLVMPDELTSPAQMSREAIIETAVDFLRQNGYSVEAFNEASTSPPPARDNFETAIMLDKLRGLVTSHMSNRAHIDEACELIGKLKALL